MLSYRGYGKSTGTPSETGIKLDSQVKPTVDFLFVKTHVGGFGFYLE